MHWIILALALLGLIFVVYPKVKAKLGKGSAQAG